MKFDRDVLVIGGGAAGLTAAGMAAVLGAKSTLVEARMLGGDCTWHGCVPSKCLLHAAKIAHEMRRAAALGLTPADPTHDLATVLSRVHAIREHVYRDADAPPNMEKLGVEIVNARARFLDKHTLELDEQGTIRRLSAKSIVIATGSRTRLPKIENDGTVPLLTNETLFELKALPKRFVVLGSGPIGMEMAQAFHRLGSHVTVVNRSPGILKRDDSELTAQSLEHLRAEGIEFVFGSEVAAIAKGSVHLKDGATIEADAALAATGRQPNFESLNLEAAGVKTNSKGVLVDARCRSSVSNIYACGDIAGRHLFTHMAEHMAKVAINNAIFRLPAKVDERHVTWCTFTDPELAHVGQNEDELKNAGVKHIVYRFPFSKLDRAITESQPGGMIKVMATRGGRILGASILGANAGEMIAEYALAMKNGISLSKISSTIHAYPTYSLGNRRAADKHVSAWLTPGLVGWIQRIFRLHGSREGASALNSE